MKGPNSSQQQKTERDLRAAKRAEKAALEESRDRAWAMFLRSRRVAKAKAQEKARVEALTTLLKRRVRELGSSIGPDKRSWVVTLVYCHNNV